MVDAEVEEALARNVTLPAAARVERHQLLRRRQAEVALELEQRLPELVRVFLLGGLASSHILRDEALHVEELFKTNPPRKLVVVGAPLPPHLDFSLDEAGHILLVLEHGQRVEEVVEQPVPVFVHLLHGSSWHSEGDQSVTGKTRITEEVEEVLHRSRSLLTTGDDPAALRAGNLEEDPEGRDPGIGVQHCVQRPHQETCGVVAETQSLFQDDARKS